MQLKAHEFRPRTGPHTYRIIQPRHPLRHTTLNDPLRSWWGYLQGDHDGLSRLAALFSFAAFSRHTIVHIPLREGPPREFFPDSPVDLVLAHHTLGLRPSAWPGLRRTLRQGAPLTVRTNEQRTAAHAAAWEARSARQDARDWLRPATHARTLFLFGSRDVFASASTQFEYAAGFGPRHKRVAEGHDALAASLSPQLAPEYRRHHNELDIGFRAYPPFHHFRLPGRPASRRPRTAASP
ncbi:hypothetical protein [Streptomyces sp. NBC_01304]|uniref:hypothetical protein n=1 Tax=Streptomyces sp. NBC_01304 TaxID=2903818 RepID=UPI002E119465|nr:hypothetical protein OG430_21110 [Streptomyces sp. NBC_01304]